MKPEATANRLRKHAASVARDNGHRMRWMHNPPPGHYHKGYCIYCDRECNVAASDGEIVAQGNYAAACPGPNPKPPRLQMVLPGGPGPQKTPPPALPGKDAGKQAMAMYQEEMRKPPTAEELRDCIRRLMAFWCYSTDDEMPGDLYDRAFELAGDGYHLRDYVPQYRKLPLPSRRGARVLA